MLVNAEHKSRKIPLFVTVIARKKRFGNRTPENSDRSMAWPESIILNMRQLIGFQKSKPASGTLMRRPPPLPKNFRKSGSNQNFCPNAECVKIPPI